MYIHSDLRLLWIYSEMNIIDICNFKNLNYKLCLIYVRQTLQNVIVCFNFDLLIFDRSELKLNFSITY